MKINCVTVSDCVYARSLQSGKSTLLPLLSSSVEEMLMLGCRKRNVVLKKKLFVLFGKKESTVTTLLLRNRSAEPQSLTSFFVGFGC